MEFSSYVILDQLFVLENMIFQRSKIATTVTLKIQIAQSRCKTSKWNHSSPIPTLTGRKFFMTLDLFNFKRQQTSNKEISNRSACHFHPIFKLCLINWLWLAGEERRKRQNQRYCRKRLCHYMIRVNATTLSPSSRGSRSYSPRVNSAQEVMVSAPYLFVKKTLKGFF